MVLDAEVLSRYAADDLLAHLAQMFAEDAPRMLRDVVDADTLPALALAAHKLRGCALSLGAGDLAAAAAAVESAARAGDPAARPAAAALAPLVLTALEALRLHCSAMQTAPLADTTTR